MNETVLGISGLIVSIWVAIFTLARTYTNSLRLQRYTARLERINRQLGELYGPLYALRSAQQTAYKAFRKKYRPHKKRFFDKNDPPGLEDLKAWRLWISTVFMPLNQQMFDIIVSRSNLLIEAEMPKSFLLFCAHFTTYKALLKTWEDEEKEGKFSTDLATNVTLIPFPRWIDKYLQSSFLSLKAEQARLLDLQYKFATTNNRPFLKFWGRPK